mmetsp:Transcript_51412/g.149331  ORF Transcript_51412/g.149331 Transcript_51412/m.149331 type:complete len:295 (-) Transcript_51412:813-1697(-)
MDDLKAVSASRLGLHVACCGVLPEPPVAPLRKGRAAAILRRRAVFLQQRQHTQTAVQVLRVDRLQDPRVVPEGQEAGRDALLAVQRLLASVGRLDEELLQALVAVVGEELVQAAPAQRLEARRVQDADPGPDSSPVMASALTTRTLAGDVGQAHDPLEEALVERARQGPRGRGRRLRRARGPHNATARHYALARSQGSLQVPRIHPQELRQVLQDLRRAALGAPRGHSLGGGRLGLRRRGPRHLATEQRGGEQCQQPLQREALHARGGERRQHRQAPVLRVLQPSSLLSSPSTQ